MKTQKSNKKRALKLLDFTKITVSNFTTHKLKGGTVTTRPDSLFNNGSLGC